MRDSMCGFHSCIIQRWVHQCARWFPRAENSNSNLNHIFTIQLMSLQLQSTYSQSNLPLFIPAVTFTYNLHMWRMAYTSQVKLEISVWTQVEAATQDQASALQLKLSEAEKNGQLTKALQDAVSLHLVLLCFTNVCMYVCMYVRVYVRMTLKDAVSLHLVFAAFINVCMYECMWYIHTYVHTHAHMGLYIYSCLCTQLCVKIFMHVRTYVVTYVCMYIRTYLRKCMYLSYLSRYVM